MVSGLSPSEMRIAVVAITRNGSLAGERLRAGLPGAQLHVSRRYADTAGPDCSSFEPGELRPLLAELWQRMDGLVLIMATGIVVRMIAPLLRSKQTDPAVVVMDDAGRFAISLLSGHLGGANDLAARCGALTGALPVITTATDANGLPSFDLLAGEFGWRIEDITRVKSLNRLLLDNDPIGVVDRTGRLRERLGSCRSLRYFDSCGEALRQPMAGYLFITDRSEPSWGERDDILILRPGTLALGIGCNRGTSADELEAFVAARLAEAGLAAKSVCRIGTAAVKRDEAGLSELARRLGCQLVYFESAELNSVTVPSEPSSHAMKAIGATGVAEPAALLAAGGGRLLLPKVKSGSVTLAVAELPAA